MYGAVVASYAPVTEFLVEGGHVVGAVIGDALGSGGARVRARSESGACAVAMARNASIAESGSAALGVRGRMGAGALIVRFSIVRDGTTGRSEGSGDGSCDQATTPRPRSCGSELLQPALHVALRNVHVCAELVTGPGRGLRAEPPRLSGLSAGN